MSTPRRLALARADCDAPSRYRVAFDATLPELEALDDDELLSVNLDVPTVLTTVLGVLPVIEELRPRVVRLSESDERVLDSLERYALTLGHAHALTLTAIGSSTRPRELAERAREMREGLLADAKTLARRRLIDPRAFNGLRGAKAYRHLAFDVASLAALLRRRWAAIEGKTALTLTEIERAEMLADELLVAIGRQKRGRDRDSEAKATRKRAFTLLLRSYDEVRRAVIYLCWHRPDREQVAPSLYSGRRKNSQSKDASPPAPGGNEKKNDTSKKIPATA